MTLASTSISQDLWDRLIEEYLEIKKRYSMCDWGPGQLKGGRFAEVVLRVFQQLLSMPITPLGTDVSAKEKTNILNAVQSHPALDEHVRQKTVPLIRLLLDFRNNRDSAHLGGFNANAMDTLFVMTSATWVLCELIRVYRGCQMPNAQKIVDGFAVKEYPVIMEVDGDAFITRHDLTTNQEVLVLLSKYSRMDSDTLFVKTKDKNKTRFKNMLTRMVAEKTIGETSGQYFIMPRGVEVVISASLLTYA